ncbi:MAG TPA: outer membrane lipoprotein carrier protein LolA, partial [Nannocystaceae bacterium]|nr:outer membrane lipoprotein carrier protein LolA [Nannocystaceae bacterium]
MVLLRALALASLLVGLSAAPARAAAPAPAATARITRDELVTALRAVPGVQARYKEERRIALLAAPLVSEGRIHFAPPTRLARHQTSPSKASVVVDGKRLRFGDDVGKDDIDLASNPVVAVFVDSFLQVLAGDADALQKHYTIEFAGGTATDARAWTMTLRPRAAPMTKIVERITLRGREAVVRELEVLEVGGDSTLTTFMD